jgi:hypothetical protein
MKTGSSPNDYDGWTSYTAFQSAPGIDQFLGYFSVPDMPKSEPEILYMFTGLQNIDWIPVVDPEPQEAFDIIQPVLQFPGDGGRYWSVKSWYVTLDVGTVASNERRLQPGDQVFGNMTRTGPTSFYIGSTSAKTGSTTYLSVNHDRLASQPWSYNTVECYGCDGCSTYPTKPLEFTKLQMSKDKAPITPSWINNPKPSHNTQCHEKATISGPDHVTFTFQ